MRIGELRQHIGEEVSLVCYLQEARETSNKYKNRWMDLVVSDGSGETVLKMWAEQFDAKVKDLEGRIIRVVGEVDLFQDRAGVNVAFVSEAEEGTYALSDFLPSISEGEEMELRSRLTELVAGMADSRMKLLVSYVLKPRLDKMASSLGGSDHHRYIGGLLRHSVEVAELAKNSAEQCKLSREPYCLSADTDLCVAAALLHDVGKMSSIMEGPSGRRTKRGLLIDPETESALAVSKCNMKLGDRGVEDLSCLLHIIMMCNHRKEGLRPRTMEAIIVSDANRQSVKRDAYGYAFYSEERKEGAAGSFAYSRALGATLVKWEEKDG